MSAVAWRKALHFTVTVRRNTTAVSASGSTKFVYTTVISGLACSLQDRGGRMIQTDVGQVPDRTLTALFGEEAIGLLQQNDLLVVESDGRTYKVFHIHEVIDPNAPHVEASVEQWVPGGGD